MEVCIDSFCLRDLTQSHAYAGATLAPDFELSFQLTVSQLLGLEVCGAMHTVVSRSSHTYCIL